MEIPKDKKIYFSSDNHLGSPSIKDSHEREKIFIPGSSKALCFASFGILARTPFSTSDLPLFAKI